MKVSRLWITALLVGLAMGAIAPAQITALVKPSPPSASSFQELKRLLMDRYNGKMVVTEVSGLYAGEQQKNFLGGPGKNGISWFHFEGGMQVPGRIATPDHLFGVKISGMDQLDARTYGDMAHGLNASPIRKWEPLKVYKFYVRSNGVEFVLSTTNLGHMRDMDMNKASKDVTTIQSGTQTTRIISVGGFGFVFYFYFPKNYLKEDHDYKRVVSEINRYLLPEAEARKAAAAARNVDIEPGMTWAQVVQELGQPVRSIKFGNTRSLMYKGMTVILKDGKVTNVKLE